MNGNEHFYVIFYPSLLPVRYSACMVLIANGLDGSETIKKYIKLLSEIIIIIISFPEERWQVRWSWIFLGNDPHAKTRIRSELGLVEAGGDQNASASVRDARKMTVRLLSQWAPEFRVCGCQGQLDYPRVTAAQGRFGVHRKFVGLSMWPKDWMMFVNKCCLFGKYTLTGL